MATVVSKRSPSISTIVRNFASLYSVRLGFLIGGWLAPEAAVRKAAALFTQPFASSRARALAAPTYGAAELDLSVDGTPIHAYVWGDPKQQPYVLFAHGWSSHGTRIGPWLKPLRDAGYAVVAFDQAGHGRSGGTHTTLPDFACHLLAVGHHFGPAAAVIGHSLGGAATALALGLATEHVALKGDIGRMNTVFKLSLQAWLLMGVAAAVGFAAVWTSRERRSVPARIWAVALVVLAAGGAVYPIIAVPARTHDRFTPMSPGLDGKAYMSTAVYADAPDGRPDVRFPLSNDLAAIDWLRANVDGSPVVLEATIPEYRWGSRVSIYTGLPTVLGWNWHETQQRPGFGMMLEERRTDVQRMLGETTSFDSVRPLLDKYHVRLIYVGDLERAYYDASALAKFEDAAREGELTVVYDGPGVTIYEYPGASD